MTLRTANWSRSLPYCSPSRTSYCFYHHFIVPLGFPNVSARYLPCENLRPNEKRTETAQAQCVPPGKATPGCKKKRPPPSQAAARTPCKHPLIEFGTNRALNHDAFLRCRLRCLSVWNKVILGEHAFPVPSVPGSLAPPQLHMNIHPAPSRRYLIQRIGSTLIRTWSGDTIMKYADRRQHERLQLHSGSFQF